MDTSRNPAGGGGTEKEGEGCMCRLPGFGLPRNIPTTRRTGIRRADQAVTGHLLFIGTWPFAEYLTTSVAVRALPHDGSGNVLNPLKPH